MIARGSQTLTALLAAFAGLITIGAPAWAADLSIAHVEITQGLQTSENDIPLVRSRPTVIRVFPVVRGLADPPQVSAILHASRMGQELPDSPRRPAREPVSAALVLDRTTDRSALIFELPEEWTVQDTDFWVEFVPPGGFVDDDPANDRHPQQGVLTTQFKDSGKLNIRFMAIRFNDGERDRLPDPRVSLIEAVAWLQSTFPIAPSDVRYSPWLTPEFTFANPADSLLPSSDLDGAALINRLNEMQLESKLPDLLFAWTPVDSFRENGKSDPPFRLAPLPPGRGKVAFGNSNPERYRRTIAHEMAHILGINCHHKVSLTGDIIGYDVSAADPAQRVRFVSTAGAPLFDIMKPGETEANAWIISWTYQRLLSALTAEEVDFALCQTEGGVNGDGEAVAGAGGDAALGPLVETALAADISEDRTRISAEIERADQLLAIQGATHEGGSCTTKICGTFFDFYRVPAEDDFRNAASAAPIDGRGSHEIRIIGRSGQILQSIQWTPFADEDDSETPTAATPFTWFVPERRNVREILLLAGDRILATRLVPQRKARAENLRIGDARREDSAGRTAREMRTLTWSELRFGTAKVRHHLSFSNTDGLTWIPLAANLAASPKGEVSVDIDQSMLPGGPLCRFRVTTSDGYHETELRSDRFDLPNRPPQVEILSPAASRTLRQGAMLRLAGGAFDPEQRGEAVPDEKLVWSLDGQKVLGDGPQLEIEASDLPPGKHEIHLKATDRAGNTAQDVVTVEVLPPDEP